MDSTSEFFAKLRKVAVTLETETTKLQAAFENQSSDDDSGERTSMGIRAYHELHCDLLKHKEQIQDEVREQKKHLDDVSCFLKDCDVLQLKLSEDINIIKTHWEKYGYHPPKNMEATNDASDNSPKEEAVTEGEGQLPDPLEGPHEETGEDLSSEKPAAPLADPMRTPQLSDFGLSEIQLKRTLGVGEWCSEVPQMPEMILSHSVLNTPAPPGIAVTPKRALCMDEDELVTPQMHTFDISERTVFFNNDFTMNLPLRNVEKTKKPQRNLLEPPFNPLIENLQANEDLESPEPPVFCTPGLKIKKTHVTESCSESPTCPAKLPSTPDVPGFQTPYVNRLLSTKSERGPKLIKMESDDDNKVSSSSTPPHGGTAASKCSLESDVPHLMIEDVMSCEGPKMPSLESNLGNTLQIRSAKMNKMILDRENPFPKALELDGPTQEFNLRTPCIQRDSEEPSTPELPDLSSVTRDICKLVSQMKKSVNAETKLCEKENSSPPQIFDTLSRVSEQEFQSLPSYLRQMTLNSLNQAVDNINRSIAKCKRDKTEFHIEELKRMIDFGAKTPLFIHCLSELKRMDQIRGSLNNSVYKLKTLL